MLTIENLTHGFGERALYSNVNITINKGDKIGLVGPNGAGKSTLINLINGSLCADNGKVHLVKKVKLGYLDQYAEIDGNLTILEYLETAFAELKKKEREYEEINLKFQTCQVDDLDKLINKTSELFDYLQRNNVYEIESIIKKVGSGLGLDEFGYDTLISKLSGGQRAKVILAKLILEKPDLIVLDEPTNFLDTIHIEWLKKYLKNLEGTFLIVSHDIEFLDDICNVIWSIEQKNILRYVGNYSAYLKQRELKEEIVKRSIEKQEEKIAKLEDYIARHSAKTYSAKQAQSRKKQLDKIERIEKIETLPKPHYSFKYKPLSAREIFKLKELSIGYCFPLLKNINLSVYNADKIRILGFNGIGKSTLLKTIISKIPPIKGTVETQRLLNKKDIGYFEQEIVWENPNLTPIEFIRNEYPDFTDKEIRSALAKAGIPSKLQMEKLDTLSGGEQSKVKLCKFILEPFTVLILDEPTNHLDVNAKDALAEAINKYPGTILFVSHDEDFVKKVKAKEFDLKACKLS